MINLKLDKTFTSLAAVLGFALALAAMPAQAQIVTSGDTTNVTVDPYAGTMIG